MALGAGHPFVFLTKLVNEYRPHEVSLGGRLLKTLPKINMSMKGHNQNVAPMLTYNPNDNWPRFLVAEAADGNPKPFTDRMDVFPWHKAVEGMGRSYKSIKLMNDGRQLLVHFDNKVYSDNLLRADKLIDIHVKITPHKALSSSKCVIGCKELRNMDEEDIKDQLKSQGVTKVERMKRRKDGQLVPSDSYILTIYCPNIPPQIKVCFLIHNTKVYIPNLQCCFNCQKYGHNKRFCKNEAKCGQAGHDDHECENEAKCANCNGHHPAYVRSGPKWKTENEIIKVKYQKNIPFHEARQQVEEPVIDPSKNSYATVSKCHQWTSNIKAPNTFKTEEEWLTHTIDSLLKRLDAIKAQKSIQNKQSTSSASQLCEITLPMHASEHTNESRKLNSASAMPSNVQHDTYGAQSDENEMELNITTRKRAIHEVSSEEEPTNPLPTKRTVPGPLASGQDGTFVAKGAGRGGPSKISSFCPNPPRSGGQGSSGRDRSPIRLPEGTKPSVPPKPGNQSKSKNDKNSPY